jgi:hypothetical protein
VDRAEGGRRLPSHLQATLCWLYAESRLRFGERVILL